MAIVSTKTQHWNSKWDFRAVDPKQTPTYFYAPQRVAWESMSAQKGPAGRRRRKFPLVATPYLRYNCITSSCRGRYTLKPAGWTYWTTTDGVIHYGQKSTILGIPDLFSTDPLTGGYMPIPTLTQQGKVDNDILKQAKNQKLQVLTVLGEAKKTFGYFGDSVKDIAGMISGVQKGSAKSIQKAIAQYNVRRRRRGLRSLKQFTPSASWASKRASERYLEVTYAVTPLYYDITGAAGALADFVVGRPIICQVESKWTVNTEHGPVQENTPLMQQGVILHYSGVARRVYRKAYTFQVDTAWLAQLSALGVTSPAGTVVELTKWSFIVDWFASVGDFSSLWDAPLGLTLLDAYVSTYCQLTLTGKFKVQSSAALQIDAPPQVSYQGWVRKPLTYWPYPALNIENPISMRRAATVAALVRQVLG